MLKGIFIQLYEIDCTNNVYTMHMYMYKICEYLVFFILILSLITNKLYFQNNITIGKKIIHIVIKLTIQHETIL